MLCSPSPLFADARIGYLVRLLQGSSQFRVRAQAAISLGSAGAGAEVVSALVDALSDRHPAVRAASATSLGRVGAGEAVLAGLRAALADKEQPVRLAAERAIARVRGRPPPAAHRRPEPPGPKAGARYYVAISRPASAVPGFSPGLLERAQRFLSMRLAAVGGVEFAPPDEGFREATRVIERHKLKGYLIETSVTHVQARPGGGTRVAVSLILATYPGRNMRAIMRGAATAVGGGADTLQQALEGALTGALRRLPQAMERAGAKP